MPVGRSWLVKAVLLFGVLGSVWAWSWASPVGSSPDEPAHIVYAWGTATGQTLPWRAREGFDSNASREVDYVTMPVELLEYPEPSCFIVGTAGTCQVAARGDGNFVASTYMVRYPLTYYAAIGLVLRAGIALGLSGGVVLVAGRIVSGLMFALGIVAAICVLRRRFDLGAAFGVVLLVCAPNVLFLAASINPNGFEIGMTILLASLCAAVVFDARNSTSWGRDTLVGIPLVTFLLATTRPLSFVWAAAILASSALAIVLGRCGRRAQASGGRASWLALAATALVLAFSLIWFGYQYAGSSEDASSADDGPVWGSLAPRLRVWIIVLRFGELLKSGFGLMGWADTAMPDLAFLLWVVTVSIVCVRLLDLRYWRRIVPGVSAFLLSSTAVVAQSYLAGFGWQGRYWFPVVAAGLVMLIPGGGARTGIRRTGLGVLGALAFAVLQFWGIWVVLRRYEYGFHSPYVRFSELAYAWRAAVWQPSVRGVLLVALAASVFLAWGVAMASGRRVRAGERTVGRGGAEDAEAWIVLGVVEGLNPRKDDDHVSTEEVPRGAQGAGDPPVPGGLEGPRAG